MNLSEVPYHNLFEEFIRRAAEAMRQGSPIDETVYDFERNFKALSKRVKNESHNERT